MLTREWKFDKVLEVSKKEGELKKTKEIAKNLPDAPDVRTISKKTGLSIEETEK